MNFLVDAQLRLAPRQVVVGRLRAPFRHERIAAALADRLRHFRFRIVHVAEQARAGIAQNPGTEVPHPGHPQPLDDPRGQLVWQPLVWARAIRPRWIACEQVPQAKQAFAIIAHELRSLGYHAVVTVLSAEQYGVAQTRRRHVLLATAIDEPGPGVILDALGADEAARDLRWAIGDLSAIDRSCRRCRQGARQTVEKFCARTPVFGRSRTAPHSALCRVAARL